MAISLYPFYMSTSGTGVSKPVGELSATFEPTIGATFVANRSIGVTVINKRPVVLSNKGLPIYVFFKGEPQ